MRRRLSFPAPSPAMAIAVVALLAATGGWAVAASSTSTVIRACANKKNGALRLASRCRKSERSVSWNKEGVQGPHGLSGATGATGTSGATGATGTGGVPGPAGSEGARGPEGPQGPGATSFSTTLPEGTTSATLLTLPNGVRMLGKCTPPVVGLTLETVDPEGNLEASGTLNKGETTAPVDINGETTLTGVEGAKQVDFDVIVRDRTVGTFERVDAYVVAGMACPFRGMITPSH